MESNFAIRNSYFELELERERKDEGKKSFYGSKQKAKSGINLSRANEM